MKKIFALINKLSEVVAKIRSNPYEDALNKLRYDIRPKMDGDFITRDWVTDSETQNRLCTIIDHIIGGLQQLQS